MYVTGPYLEGKGAQGPQMHELTGPDDARALVSFWADQGATSFKAYKNITRAELSAAIAEAHKRGLKVTGHLCSITYPEAIALGIDNLEHGPIGTDAEFVPGKQPDVCPGAPAMFASWEQPPISSAPRAGAHSQPRRPSCRDHVDARRLRAARAGTSAAAANACSMQ